MRGNISDYTLTVKGGPNADDLSLLSVNNEDSPTRIESDLFSGYLLVRMKDFSGSCPDQVCCLSNPKSGYFSSKQRLYTISVQGSFKEDVSGDDLIFGLDFDHPIKTPPGASIGLRIARWLEPSLEYELNGSNPYMIAPGILKSLMVVLTCINFMAIHSKEEFISKYPLTKNNDPVDQNPRWAYNSNPITESNSRLLSDSVSIPTPAERKKYFVKKANRSNVIFRKSDIVSFEFYDAHFDFNQFRIVLPGFSLNALKYWNGHPIRFICSSNDRKKTYFVVVFDLRKSDLCESNCLITKSTDSVNS